MVLERAMDKKPIQVTDMDQYLSLVLNRSLSCFRLCLSFPSNTSHPTHIAYTEGPPGPPQTIGISELSISSPYSGGLGPWDLFYSRCSLTVPSLFPRAFLLPSAFSARWPDVLTQREQKPHVGFPVLPGISLIDLSCPENPDNLGTPTPLAPYFMSHSIKLTLPWA